MGHIGRWDFDILLLFVSLFPFYFLSFSCLLLSHVFAVLAGLSVMVSLRKSQVNSKGGSCGPAGSNTLSVCHKQQEMLDFLIS